MIKTCLLTRRPSTIKAITTLIYHDRDVDKDEGVSDFKGVHQRLGVITRRAPCYTISWNLRPYNLFINN